MRKVLDEDSFLNRGKRLLGNGVLFKIQGQSFMNTILISLHISFFTLAAKDQNKKLITVLYSITVA